MTDPETMHLDAKRDALHDMMERLQPEPCGCEWLSECCGARPHEATPDVGKDNQAGICGQCREFTGFELGGTWACIGRDPNYGADADGRGVMLYEWECSCGELASTGG